MNFYIVFIADQIDFQQAFDCFLLNGHPGADWLVIDRLSPAITDSLYTDSVLVCSELTAFKLLNQTNPFITGLHHRLRNEN